MRPQVGDTIRVFTGEGEHEQHICTVQDTLATQLRATYEWQRADGGWNERSLFCFYGDVEWNARAREWQGKQG
jgi:hypothetical protein